MQSHIIQILLLFCLIFVINCQVQIKVFSPADLVDKYKRKDISLTLANYGYVPYGKSLIGNLHLANPRNGCSPLQPFMTKNNHSDPSPIVVIERGGCHFVTKTHYAQLIGAKMALIIDDKEENENYVIMIDDGFGHDINIPTIMISKEDGKNILTYLDDEREEVKSSPNPDDQVEYELWMSSMDITSYQFLKSFNKYQEDISSFTSFTPHYALWFCPACKDLQYKDTKNDNCVSSGRYCAPDPDGDGPLTGKEVVLEDLRQICLYNQNNKTWWGYVQDFEDKCLNSTEYKGNLSKCSEIVYLKNGYDKKDVEKCISTSFKNANDLESDNTLLATERSLFIGEGIQIWPSIRINNVTYRGNLIPPTGVFDAICEGMQHPLGVCNKEIIEKENASSGGSNVALIVILVICCLVIFMVLILFFYKRMIRREMSKELQLQVNTTISQYFALREERKV